MLQSLDPTTFIPPHEPLLGAPLMACAAGLDFRATSYDRSGRSLGVLVDKAGARQHLSISPGGAWTLSATLSRGLESVLLYESAANVLRGGDLRADGSISYQGSSYVLEPGFDGTSRTARVRGQG